jgi:hypothetical protein
MPSGVEKLSFDVEELSSLAVTENANVWNDDNNSMCIRLQPKISLIRLRYELPLLHLRLF